MLIIGEGGILYNKEMNSAQILAGDVQKLFALKKIPTAVFTTDKLSKDVSIALAIGGDGTILRAARFYCQYEIGVLGINLGRLGILSQSNPNEIENIADSIIQNNYNVQDRMMIEEETTQIAALNDIVIKSTEAGRTSKFKLFINNKFLCEYLADGIIISTPTGSSAYNLSAGGPVINPTLDVFVITAICPHTLSARPLVVPSNDIISITTCDSEETFNIIGDGQITKKITYNEITTIKKHANKAKLIMINKPGNDFYSILRDKLYWGVAPSC